MKEEYRIAFTEVNEIMKLMPIELINKIPSKFREMIKEEKDNNYIPDIKEPIEKCKLKNETIIILGLIYRDFLCSQDERKKLQEKDARELQKVKKDIEEMREKYNPDDIFKKKNQNNMEESNAKEENTSMVVVQEEKWYEKIFNLIKRIFKRNK